MAPQKSAPAPEPSGRKPWVKKTPVEIFLEKIVKQEERVAEMREALPTRSANSKSCKRRARCLKRSNHQGVVHRQLPFHTRRNAMSTERHTMTQIAGKPRSIEATAFYLGAHGIDPAPVKDEIECKSFIFHGRGGGI